MSLRTRLFLSYVGLLVVALAVMGVTLLLFIASRPAPPEATYSRLAAIVQGLNIRDLLRDSAPNSGRLPTDYNRVVVAMDELAQTRDVRVLWLATLNNRQVVLYDTRNVYAAQGDLLISSEDFFSATLEKTLFPSARQIYGHFRDPNGEEWLFGGIVREFPLQRRSLTSTLIVAELRPTQPLSATLSQFRHSILPPLVQAGVIGLLFAFVLAFWMSRTLAQPLQTLARGVKEIARGNYQERVKETSNVREMRDLAHGFNVMAREVHHTQQAQRDFLANVSHDLKTPLTSIQGYSQAIIDGATPDPKRSARVIYDEAVRLTRLVNAVTDLSRMQSGQMTLKLSPLDISALVQGMGERLSMLASKKQVCLHVDAQPVPTVLADGDRLAQVVTNLLSNAIKFTPSGGEIWLETLPQGEGVLIRVRDSGEGIAQGELERIFERFYQADKARGPERGTGLGLAIVKEIVEAHGGRVRAESDGLKRGATFSVWLPSRPKPSR
jgi:signal transduction histidine kinase